jgi:hypothetical protein
MADNTTTYNVVVETEVKGEDSVGNLGDTAETTGGKFTRLQRQIRDTQIALQKASEEGDKATFNKLKGDLDDLQDKLELTQLSSQQFDDALAGLPGPAGQAGQAIKSLDGVFKAFLANPILVTIAAIAGVFLALKEALNRTEEGQAKLNKISEAFEKIMNGLFAILEPIANIFADLIIALFESDQVMNALSKTAGVLSAIFTTVFKVLSALTKFVIGNVVNAFKTLADVAGGVGSILKGVFTFDLDTIKKGLTQVSDGIKNGFNSAVDNVKGAFTDIKDGIVTGITEGYAAGEKAFKTGNKRLTKAEKEAAEKRKKELEEQGKKNAEAAKKGEEERGKAIADAQKVEVEAYLSTLDARDQEIYKRGVKLNEDLDKLEKGKEAKLVAARKKGAKEVAKVEEQFNQARLQLQAAYTKDADAINAKFDEEAKKKEEERKAKAIEEYKKTVDGKLLAFENGTKKLANAYNNEIAVINQKEQEALAQLGLTEDERKSIRDNAAAERKAATARNYDEQIQIINDKEKLLLSNIELTEEQITQIQLTAEDERRALREGDFENRLLANENDFRLLEEKYNKEIALVNERERMMLSVSTLTEEQKKQIIDTASADRLALQTQRYDEQIALVNQREQLLLSNTALTEAQRTQIALDASQERKSIEQLATEDAILGIDTELERIGTTYDRKRELIGMKEAELLAQEGLTENQRTAIIQQAADERTAIGLAEMEARAEMQNAYLDLAGQFGSFLKEIAGKNKKLAIAGVIVEQAAAIGKIIVNTGIANAKAVAATPLTGGMPFVAINTVSAALSIASSVAAGVKAIQQINSADSGAAPSGGGLPKSGGGASAAPPPVAPTVERATVPQITGMQAQASPGSQIAQTLAARSEKPLKAYVVSGDVTSQQALDRRTTRAATFSGGTNA